MSQGPCRNLCQEDLTSQQRRQNSFSEPVPWQAWQMPRAGGLILGLVTMCHLVHPPLWSSEIIWPASRIGLSLSPNFPCPAAHLPRIRHDSTSRLPDGGAIHHSSVIGVIHTINSSVICFSPSQPSTESFPVARENERPIRGVFVIPTVSTGYRATGFPQALSRIRSLTRTSGRSNMHPWLSRSETVSIFGFDFRLIYGGSIPGFGRQ